MPAGGSVGCPRAMENTMAASQRRKIGSPGDSAVSLPCADPEEPDPPVSTELIAVSVTGAKKWKRSQRPRTDEETNNMSHIHSMGHYPALKKKEMLTQATT